MYLLRFYKRRLESGDRKLSRLTRLAAMYYFCRTLRPSRSWAKGVARVRTWSCDEMYTESECWEHMRFHKHHFPVLLRELELHDSGKPDGLWRVRNTDGVAQYAFQPMELLVIFLARLATMNTWPGLLKFLGERSPTAYKAGFYMVLHHI